jgi:hypothetical protein
LSGIEIGFIRTIGDIVDLSADVVALAAIIKTKGIRRAEDPLGKVSTTGHEPS